MFKLSESQGPIRVGFYLARRFSILPFINAVDPLRMANRLSNRNLFEWTFISRDGKPVEAINGMTIMVDLPLEEAGFIPNVVCCVGFDPIIQVRDPVKSWLRKLNSMGAHLGALGAGTDFLASLIDDFLRDGEELIEELRAAVEARNVRDFRDIVHGMRGSAMHIGGVGLYQLLLSYRKIRPMDMEQHGQDYLDKITEEFYSLRGALTQYLREHMDDEELPS